jgi:hypothetical protein
VDAIVSARLCLRAQSARLARRLAPGRGTVVPVWGIRWVAAAAVGAAVAATLSGCSGAGWCAPLEPGPSVTAEYAPTSSRLEALPGVTRVSARFWQPDDSHCVSRKYLRTAPWSADFTVHVRSGFTLEQVRAVRAALGPSMGTVSAAASGDRSAWELELSNPSGATPSPTAAPLLVDDQGYRVATEAAALPGVTVAQVDGGSTTVRVRTPGSVMAATAWLRAHFDDPADTWVYVGTSRNWSMSTGVTGQFGASDTTIATAARVVTDHPGVHRMEVGGTGVTAVVPTRRQAQQVVAAFEQTPRDQDGQTVSVWWPDGNGTEVSGVVGSRR